jgi:hypothetical protein
MYGERVDDAALRPLQALSGLKELRLGGDFQPAAVLDRLFGTYSPSERTPITNSGLQYLRGLKQLHELYLSSSDISDAGMSNLKELKELRTLDLAETIVGDRGLERLAKLNELQTLLIDGTRVTDKGLEHLRGLSHLRLIAIDRTKTTPTGAAKLRKALPGVHVRAEPLPMPDRMPDGPGEPETSEKRKSGRESLSAFDTTE